MSRPFWKAICIQNFTTFTIYRLRNSQMAYNVYSTLNIHHGYLSPFVRNSVFEIHKQFWLISEFWATETFARLLSSRNPMVHIFLLDLWIYMALTRLWGYLGWCVPLLFTWEKLVYSHKHAHIRPLMIEILFIAVCPRSWSLQYTVDPCKLKITWKNRSFRNRENLQYKKTAGSVLLSLFMRTNGKCNNSHAP